MRKNLLDLNLQLFGEEEGVNDVTETADQSEGTEETTEAEETETGATETEPAEPQEQSAEDNARYAAIRRRAEDDARRRYEGEMNAMNNQIAAMCRGITHPVTGQPITNVRDYMDALAIQQRQANEQELQEKGVDPQLIDRMIAQNPIVMQAQQVIERSQVSEAENRIEKDIAELNKIDPTIKGIQDLAELPTFPDIVNLIANNGLSLIDAYKTVNFDSFMQHTNDAARQQAINQMRGKSHLQSQTPGVSTGDDDVEVPAEIMSNWKAEGKTEKQIRELYKKTLAKLHIN